MKTVLGALSAVLLAAPVCSQPAQAQPAPQGSYLESCRHIAMRGDTLFANCRRIDGSWQRTAVDVDRCRGDIANINGHLRCGGGSGGYSDRREGYGSSQPEDWRADHQAQCAAIGNPYERERCWGHR